MKNNAALIFHRIDFSLFSYNELEELIKWSIYFKLKLCFFECKNFKCENDNDEISNDLRLIDEKELKDMVNSDKDIILVQQNSSGLEEKANILFTYDGEGIPEGSNAFMFSHLSKIRETLENLLYYRNLND